MYTPVNSYPSPGTCLHKSFVHLLKDENRRFKGNLEAIDWSEFILAAGKFLLKVQNRITKFF